MNDQPYVWQMVKEAINQLGGQATYSEIKQYIHSQYGDVNDNTITCQIIEASVNHPSRVHYPKGKKTRIANTQYDFLFNVGRGKVVKYDPSLHGIWEIQRNEDGKLDVTEVTGEKDSIYQSKSSSKSVALVDKYAEALRKIKNLELENNLLQARLDESSSVYSYISHPILKDRLSKLSSAPLDTVIREAGVVFEDCLRLSCGIDTYRYGVSLVDEALEPGGKLIFSSHGGEQQGVQYLFRGAMQFIRNPPMHKLVDYPESMAKQFLRLIDSLLVLLDHASLADEVSVDDIRFMLKRRRIPQGQMDLYNALYNAKENELESKELANVIARTPQQLSGLLGALGNRINKTEGLEDKGGISIILEITENSNGNWCYKMRPILREALEEENLIK